MSGLLRWGWRKSDTNPTQTYPAYRPRLEALQYLDFSNRSARPFERLLGRLKDVSADSPANTKLNIPVIIQNALSNLDIIDEKIREQSVKILATSQLPVARDALLNALKHPMYDVRDVVAEALGETKDPAVVLALTRIPRMPQGVSVRLDPHSDRPAVSFLGPVGRPGTPCGEVLPRRCL